MTFRSGMRARIDRFAGLSDRRIPTKLSRLECPRLMNVDFSERIAKKRRGFTRIHENVLRNASVRFKPRIDAAVATENSYGRIDYLTSYNTAGAGNANFIAGVVAMREFPAAEVVIVQKGFGAVANLQLKVSYDPTLNGGLGGFRGRMYDSGAAALVSLTVNDGDGLHAVPNRYFQLGHNASGNVALEIWDIVSGTIVGSSTSAWVGPGVSVAQDITIGVGMSAANTIGTDWLNGSVAEIRLAKTTSATASSVYATSVNARYARELVPSEITSLSGYWRLNDGSSDNTFADFTATGNNGYFPQAAPAWTTDPERCLGQSGLRFRNGSHWAHIYLTAGTTAYGTVFTGTNSRWTCRGTFAPEAPTGSAAFPDQTILWSGVGGAIPGPIGLRIVSNQFVAYYRDGANTRTPTSSIPGGVSSLVGKIVRWAIYRTGAGNGVVTLSVGYETSPGLMLTYNNTVACTAASAGLVSDDWCIGRHVTNYSTQTSGTFGTFTAADGQCLGTVDDLQLIWTNSLTQWVGLGNLAPGPLYALSEVSNWAPLSGTHLLIWYFKFDEGSGSTFSSPASFVSTIAYAGAIYPIRHDGYFWDAGLVDPYEPPRIRGIVDYKRINGDGSQTRSWLAVAGSALYDVGSGTAIPVAAGIHQSDGLVTFAQYGQRLFMAEANSQRPMVWDGKNLRWMGISAPTAPIGSVVLAAGGAFVAGTYYIYYTFRSSATGEESNPSRGVAIVPTINQKIDSFSIQTSPDFQVDQRRVWITGVGGADGSVAYLVTTINDNVTTSWTTDILSAPTSGSSISPTDGYFNHKEAPQGALVGVHKDFAFVGGNQKFPTRVWRSAVAGSPTAFQYTDSTGLYSDLDLDSGDVITAMFRNGDYLMVGIRDGAARLWSTGDSTTPINFDFLPIQHGPVGPQTWTQADGTFFYLTERDIFRVDGQNEVNISSPATEGYPSIQRMLREEIDPSIRRLYSAATLRSRDQAVFSFAEQGLVVYDFSQGVWSKYDIKSDYLAEVEDDNDDPSVFFGSDGFICKMDSGSYDGISVARSGSVVSSSVGQLVTADSVGSVARGHRVHIYDVDTDVVTEWTVYATSSTSMTFYEQSTPPANGLWCVGGIPFFVEFIVDFGDPMTASALRWLRVFGSSDSDDNILRVVYKGDVVTRLPSLANGNFENRDWPIEETTQLIKLGGLHSNVRFQIGESGYIRNYGDSHFPSLAGSIEIHAIDVEADGLDEIP